MSNTKDIEIYVAYNVYDDHFYGDACYYYSINKENIWELLKDDCYFSNDYSEYRQMEFDNPYADDYDTWLRNRGWEIRKAKLSFIL